MSHFCHYVITGQLKGSIDCYTRNIALKLNGNNPDVCLSCSAYIGKRKMIEESDL
jgi:hypothetical protein